jgi:hypothetical protein
MYDNIGLTTPDDGRYGPKHVSSVEHIKLFESFF